MTRSSVEKGNGNRILGQAVDTPLSACSAGGGSPSFAPRSRRRLLASALLGLPIAASILSASLTGPGRQSVEAKGFSENGEPGNGVRICINGPTDPDDPNRYKLYHGHPGNPTLNLGSVTVPAGLQLKQVEAATYDRYEERPNHRQRYEQVVVEILENGKEQRAVFGPTEDLEDNVESAQWEGNLPPQYGSLSEGGVASVRIVHIEQAVKEGLIEEPPGFVRNSGPNSLFVEKVCLSFFPVPRGTATPTPGMPLTVTPGPTETSRPTITPTEPGIVVTPVVPESYYVHLPVALGMPKPCDGLQQVITYDGFELNGTGEWEIKPGKVVTTSLTDNPAPPIRDLGITVYGAPIRIEVKNHGALANGNLGVGHQLRGSAFRRWSGYTLFRGFNPLVLLPVNPNNEEDEAKFYIPDSEGKSKVYAGVSKVIQTQVRVGGKLCLASSGYSADPPVIWYQGSGPGLSVGDQERLNELQNRHNRFLLSFQP